MQSIALLLITLLGMHSVTTLQAADDAEHVAGAREETPAAAAGGGAGGDNDDPAGEVAAGVAIHTNPTPEKFNQPNIKRFLQGATMKKKYHGDDTILQNGYSFGERLRQYQRLEEIIAKILNRADEFKTNLEKIGFNDEKISQGIRFLEEIRDQVVPMSKGLLENLEELGKDINNVQLWIKFKERLEILTNLLARSEQLAAFKTRFSFGVKFDQRTELVNTIQEIVSPDEKKAFYAALENLYINERSGYALKQPTKQLGQYLLDAFPYYTEEALRRERDIAEAAAKAAEETKRIQDEAEMRRRLAEIERRRLEEETRAHVTMLQSRTAEQEAEEQLKMTQVQGELKLRTSRAIAEEKIAAVERLAAAEVEVQRELIERARIEAANTPEVLAARRRAAGIDAQNTEIAAIPARALAENRDAFLAQAEVQAKQAEVNQLQANAYAIREDARTRQIEAVAKAAPIHGEQTRRTEAERFKHAKGMIALTAAAIPLTALGVLGVRQLFKSQPAIIEKGDTSILSLGDKIRNVKVPTASYNQLVLPPELHTLLFEKFLGIASAIQKGLPLSNMLFYGEAGVGKTMTAQIFARDLYHKKLANHIIVRGPAFKRLGSAAKAQKALADALRWGRKSKLPTIYIFDEADAMFLDRSSPDATEMTTDLVSTMLSFFARAVDTKAMFILCTNYPDRLDKALLNRIDPSNRVHFLPPGHAELGKLFDVYLDEHLTKNKIGISEEVQHNKEALTRKLKGLVGRHIDSLAVQALYSVLARQTKELDLKTIEEIITQATNQKSLAVY